QHLRQKCDEYGTLLIFDEVLTGFRLAPGGAQEYFGVTPDLAAFAKAMANGYPLAAFAGKEKYMQTLNETILTTTYGGETLSLAACKATMKILKNDPVHEHIFAMGNRLMTGFKEIIQEAGVPARVVGLPPAPSIRFEFEKEEENRTFQNKLFSTLCQNGIFPNEPWFITYSHQAEDIDQTLEIMEHAVRQCNG
ncbi:MAG: aminotransferase class III-fold pyridoxal phosphate-dependent enzyme, partial [bacterium]